MDFEPEYISLDFDGLVVSACEAFMDDTPDFAVSDCAYYLRIENNSASKIRLLGKDFCFTDASGNNHYEIGIGFNGEIPELSPGEYFEFASRAPLSVTDGVLHGSCRIFRDNAGVEELRIPHVLLKSHRQMGNFLPQAVH